MRVVTLISLLLILSADLRAQYVWFNEFLGGGYVVGTNLAIGNGDEIYTVGNFDNGVTIFDQSLPGSGSYIVKLTKRGDLVWIRAITSVQEDGISEIHSDGAGNIYISGMCNSTVTIADQTIPGSQGTSYIAKLDSDGTLLWYRRIGVQNIFSIAVNSDGDIALTGFLWGSVTLDTKVLTCSMCSFGTSLTTDGSVRWARTFGVGSFPVSAAIDAQGNSYFNGRFSADFTLDEHTAEASGPYSLYFVKINSDASCSWITSVHQEVPQHILDLWPQEVILGGAMSTDAQGNLIAAGQFLKSVEFGINMLQGSPNENSSSFYIAKFDAEGHIDWAKSMVNHTTGGSIDQVVATTNTFYVYGQDGLHPFIAEYSILGEEMRDTVLPFRGDLAGGFGIDSENSLYVSGRIVGEPVYRLTGFIAKLGSTMAAFPVSVPNASCATSPLEITTLEIQEASTYQWEISHQGNTVLIETTVPLLQIVPSAYGILGEFQVRVRGINENAYGSFSSAAAVSIDAPQMTLVLEKKCGKLVAKGTGPFTWFFNDAQAMFPNGQTEIDPLEPGSYFVTHQNACGEFVSNVVEVQKSIIPNIITPNGDPLNEFFVLPQFEEPNVLSIYDRNGTQVYNSVHYNNDWNAGDISGGVYFYLFKNTCIDFVKGSLTVVK